VLVVEKADWTIFVAGAHGQGQLRALFTGAVDGHRIAGRLALGGRTNC